ncbi:MAG: hypothetical protein V5A45_13685 [Haloarculaceae archaeon]
MSGTADIPPLGQCPLCGETIPVDNLGMTYRPAHGWPRMLAECPDCESAVHPE